MCWCKKQSGFSLRILVMREGFSGYRRIFWKGLCVWIKTSHRLLNISRRILVSYKQRILQSPMPNEHSEQYNNGSRKKALSCWTMWIRIFNSIFGNFKVAFMKTKQGKALWKGRVNVDVEYLQLSKSQTYIIHHYHSSIYQLGSC